MSYSSLSFWINATRFDRPAGSILLAVPMILAFHLSPHFPGFLASYLLVLCVLARSLGCLINDYADRDIDHLVTRTKNRAFAQGTMSFQSFIIMSLVLALCCATCFLELPYRTHAYCIAAPLWMMIYAWSKRWCPAPQLILAVAFSWSILLIAKISFDTIPYSFYQLFIANALWVSGFDTTYALSDLKDDLALPIYSLPKTLGLAASQYFSVLTLFLAQLLLINLYDPWNMMLCSSFFACKIAYDTLHMDRDPIAIFKSHCILGFIWILETQGHGLY